MTMMSADLTGTPYVPLKARGLIEGIIEGSVAMPDFQRDFVWKPKNVISLLASIANGWPVGSILVRIKEGTNSDFRLKPFAEMPDLDVSRVKMIVLDGQQRLTSLLHALYPEHSSHTYFVENVLDVLESDEDLSEDDFSYLTTAAFTKRFPDLKSRATSQVATVKDLGTVGGFSRWFKFVDQQVVKSEDWEVQTAREHRFGQLNDFVLPAINLGPQLGLEPVAAIFETVNRTGVRLGVDDLMLAKLYPSGFLLHDEWDSLLNRFERIGRFGDTWESRGKSSRPLTALHVLKLIAYETDRGIKRNNILQLKPAHVKHHWESACLAIEKALQFLSEYCGVVRHNLLPDDAMIYPIAACQMRLGDSVDDDLLVKWYWQAVVDESYDRNTTTLPVTDANSLLNGGLPERLIFSRRDFDLLRSDLIDRLLERKNRHDILQRGIAGLLIHKGAEDWDGKTLTSPDLDIDLHHVFPQGHSKSVGWKIGREQDPVDITANLTPLFSSTNQRVGLQPPKVFASNSAKRRRIIGHEIPETAFDVDTLVDFHLWARARAERLADRLLELC